jgi:hypothetical protein
MYCCRSFSDCDWCACEDCAEGTKARPVRPPKPPKQSAVSSGAAATATAAAAAATAATAVATAAAATAATAATVSGAAATTPTSDASAPSPAPTMRWPPTTAVAQQLVEKSERETVVEKRAVLVLKAAATRGKQAMERKSVSGLTEALEIYAYATRLLTEAVDKPGIPPKMAQALQGKIQQVSGQTATLEAQIATLIKKEALPTVEEETIAKSADESSTKARSARPPKPPKQSTASSGAAAAATASAATAVATAVAATKPKAVHVDVEPEFHANTRQLETATQPIAIVKATAASGASEVSSGAERIAVTVCQECDKPLQRYNSSHPSFAEMGPAEEWDCDVCGETVSRKDAWFACATFADCVFKACENCCNMSESHHAASATPRRALTSKLDDALRETSALLSGKQPVSPHSSTAGKASPPLPTKPQAMIAPALPLKPTNGSPVLVPKPGAPPDLGHKPQASQPAVDHDAGVAEPTLAPKPTTVGTLSPKKAPRLAPKPSVANLGPLQPTAPPELSPKPLTPLTEWQLTNTPVEVGTPLSQGAPQLSTKPSVAGVVSPQPTAPPELAPKPLTSPPLVPESTLLTMGATAAGVGVENALLTAPASAMETPRPAAGGDAEMRLSLQRERGMSERTLKRIDSMDSVHPPWTVRQARRGDAVQCGECKEVVTAYGPSHACYKDLGDDLGEWSCNSCEREFVSGGGADGISDSTLYACSKLFECDFVLCVDCALPRDTAYLSATQRHGDASTEPPRVSAEPRPTQLAQAESREVPRDGDAPLSPNEAQAGEASALGDSSNTEGEAEVAIGNDTAPRQAEAASAVVSAGSDPLHRAIALMKDCAAIDRSRTSQQAGSAEWKRVTEDALRRYRECLPAIDAVGDCGRYQDGVVQKIAQQSEKVRGKIAALEQEKALFEQRDDEAGAGSVDDDRDNDSDHAAAREHEDEVGGGGGKEEEEAWSALDGLLRDFGQVLSMAAVATGWSAPSMPLLEHAVASAPTRRALEKERGLPEVDGVSSLRPFVLGAQNYSDSDEEEEEEEEEEQQQHLGGFGARAREAASTAAAGSARLHTASSNYSYAQNYSDSDEEEEEEEQQQQHLGGFGARAREAVATAAAGSARLHTVSNYSYAQNYSDSDSDDGAGRYHVPQPLFRHTGHADEDV